MFLRDLLQGAISLQGNMPRQEDSVTPTNTIQPAGNPQNGVNGTAAQYTAPALGILRNMMQARQRVPFAPVSGGNPQQQRAIIQDNYPLAEDSYTASDYAQGSPSHNNGQVSLHGAFYNGGDLNGSDMNQRRGGTIRF